MKNMETSLSVSRGAKIAVTTIGLINNSVNAIYYHFSPGESNLENDENVSSYVTMGYINRWQRLDYVKGVLGGEYSENAWRYYSEYNFHMYAWISTWWAYNDRVISESIFEEIAKRAYKADIDPKHWDTNTEVQIFTFILGLFGV